jgi:hypothetical protein
METTKIKLGLKVFIPIQDHYKTENSHGWDTEMDDFIGKIYIIDKIINARTVKFKGSDFYWDIQDLEPVEEIEKPNYLFDTKEIVGL